MPKYSMGHNMLACMNFLKSPTTLFAVSFLICISIPNAVSQPSRSQNHASSQFDSQNIFIASVSSPDSLKQYLLRNADAGYALFKQGYSSASANNKCSMLRMLVSTGNSHVLEALDMGMEDASGVVQGVAVADLQSIAFGLFPLKDAPYDYKHRYRGSLNDGGKAYSAWKLHVAGLSAAQAIIQVESELIRGLRYSKKIEEREQIIERLVAADFRTDNPFGKLRAETAYKLHVLDSLENTVVKPAGATIYSMYAFEVFKADEKTLQRSVLPYTRQGTENMVRSEALTTLARLGSPTGADLITELIVNESNSEPRSLLFQPVSTCRDARLIPIYIGALDSGMKGMVAKEMVIALQAMTLADTFTQKPSDQSFEGKKTSEWKQWWFENKHQFPNAAQKIDIPVIYLNRPHS